MWPFALKSRRPASSRRSHSCPSTYRPRIEALEDRCLLSTGALDPTFGNGAGYVITAPIKNGSGTPGGEIMLQPDGKIILTGNSYVVGKNGKITASDFVAVRYNTDGSLDTSFGAGGIALATSAQNGVNGAFFGVNADWAALYPNAGTANDGMIVLAGSYPVQSGKNMPYVKELALVRFNANGTLDTTFGSGGEVLSSFSVGVTNLGFLGGGVVVTSTGQIVECGAVGNASGAPAYTVLARFNANGTLDTTFGQGGKVITPGPGANNLIQEPDGRLVAPASTSSGGAVLRFNANGALDTTFGSGGIVINSASDCAGAAVYPAAGTANDGKILVVGPASNGGWEVTRYNPDGTLDSTFGGSGMVNTQTGSYTARGVALQADGRAVVTGDGFILVRYNTDGSLDGTFGSGGIVTTSFPGTTSGNNTFLNVVLAPNGDIVAGGQVSTKWVRRDSSAGRRLSINSVQLEILTHLHGGSYGSLDAEF